MSRFLRIFLAVAWLLFTSVIVPAHTRGYITWGKGDSCCKPAPAARACCSACQADDDEIPFSKLPDSQKRDAQKRCAVCFTVALFDVPPAFVIFADYSGEIQKAAFSRPAAPLALFIPLTYQSRAPPILPA